MTIIACSNRRTDIARYFSETELAAIDHELSCYPTTQAVGIEAMRVVQQHRGWVSDESIEAIAAYLDMSPAELDSVATFYNLIYRQPVGRQVILLCNSVSCWMLGCETLKKRIHERLGIGFGETSTDGEYTLLPITCLGDCDHAPAMMIGDEQHHDLSAEKIDVLLSKPPGGDCG